MRKLQSKKGFTLAELLIVVAIIAILVAIGIPAFSTAMERSRETVDLANIRAAYAEFMAGTLGSAANEGYYEVDIKQTDLTKWTIDTAGFEANIDGGTMPVGTNLKKGIVWVKFSIKDSTKKKPVLSFEEATVTAWSGSKPSTITAPVTAGNDVVIVDSYTTDAVGQWFLVNDTSTS